jgi:hypothetical protein
LAAQRRVAVMASTAMVLSGGAAASMMQRMLAQQRMKALRGASTIYKTLSKNLHNMPLPLSIEPAFDRRSFALLLEFLKVFSLPSSCVGEGKERKHRCSIFYLWQQWVNLFNEQRSRRLSHRQKSRSRAAGPARPQDRERRQEAQVYLGNEQHG